MITQNITLYCKKYSVPPVVHAVQNDTNREVAARLGDLTLTGSMTAELSVFRSDGTHYDGTATIDTGTNTVTAEIDQALTQAGKQRCQIKVTESDGTGSTFTFIVDAQPDTSGVSVEQDGWSAQEIMDDIEALENGKQDKLTAGDGITIEDDTISVDSDDTLTSETKPAQAAAVGEALEEMGFSKAPVIVDTADGPIASFPDGADNYPMRSVVAEINPVQAGTGEPSPENVRPITGFSEAKMTRAGRTLVANARTENYTQGSITYTYNADGSYTLNGSNSNAGVITLNPLTPAYNATTVIGAPALVTIPKNTPFYHCGAQVYGYFTDTMQSYNTNSMGFTPTSPKQDSFSHDYAIVQIRAYYGAGTQFDNQTIYPMISLEPFTAYEKANIQTVTISLGRTVYGGTIDAISGKLTVTHGMSDMGALNWAYQSQNTRFAADALNQVIKPAPSASVAGNILCSIYATGTTDKTTQSAYDNIIAVSTAGNLHVRDSRFTDASEFISAVTGQKLVYELATPIEYDLTPEEIRSLLGTNNIWHDANGDTEATYCADTKLYIDKVLGGGSVQTLGMVRPSTTPAVLTNMGDFEDEPIRADQITAGTIRTAEIGEIQQEESDGEAEVE